MWWSKKILFLLAIISIVGMFFAIQGVLAATSTVNVQVVVPNGGGGCVGNCNPSTDNSPTISGVTTTVTFNSVIVGWSASDDHSITGVTFVYGLTNSYGQSGSVAGAYSVSLSGLASSTIYYYKISVTDSAGQTTDSAGNFQTAAGQQGDVTAPVITNISVNPSQTSAVITFNTNENSTAQVNYGLTAGFGSNAAEGGAAGIVHEITLLGLSPSTTYFFQIIATDVYLNSGNSSVLNFKTTKDTIAPPDVSNLNITTGTTYLALSWTNPSLSFAPDFAGVKVLRKTGAQATSPTDNIATVVYNGTGQSYSDNSILINTIYYYTIFSYDKSGNYSPGVFSSGKLTQVAAEICDNKVDDDSDGKIDCTDTDCTNNLVCKPPKTEICDNKIDDDENGKADCVDSACIQLEICKIKLPAEICSNNIDDDQNGKIDCADNACLNDKNCIVIVATTTTETGSKAACSDGTDNDGDGLIDYPSDKGCTGVNDSDEYNSSGSTVPAFEKLNLDKVRFFAGSHQIELFSNGGTVSGLSNSNLSLHIKKSALIGEPSSFILRIGDSEKHQFVLNSAKDTYFADSIFPSSGKKQAYIEINYGADQFDSLGINLQAVSTGQVEDNNNQKLSGVEVTLYQDNGQMFSASIFGQANPIITNNTAQFGWMVPNGKYYIVVTKDGFYDYKSPSLEANNNIINQSITLVEIPKKLVDVIDPNAPLSENVVNVAKNLAAKTKASTARAVQQIGDAAKVAQEVADDPAVQEAASKVVAPTAVGVAAVGTAAIVSWADILPLLRFLFLQPVLILGRGKREKWGSVYNSLSKLPVDLALVRLINAQTNKILQTKVTSSDGRYFFVVNAGKYRLEARKGNFLFPSGLLKDFQVDGQKSDIYHGEEIVVSEKGTVITANIPMDPSGQVIKTPRKLLLIKALRRIQNVVSWLGLVITIVTLYIAPTWYMWLLLGAHIAMTFVFKRLSKAPPAKGWGIVYDENNKKPLSNVVARLFDSKFNKLVATEVTSADGKYYFVAGENQYYISYDRDGYQPQKTEVIDLKGKEIDTVAEDVGLKKKI